MAFFALIMIEFLASCFEASLNVIVFLFESYVNYKYSPMNSFNKTETAIFTIKQNFLRTFTHL